MSDPSHVSAAENYRRLLSYAIVYWKHFIVAILGMVLVAITATAFAALMKPLMDEGFNAQVSDTVKWIPVQLLIIYLVRAIALFISTYYMSWVGRRVIFNLRREMFSQMVLLPKSFYDNSNTGDVITKFTFDVEQVANASSRAITVLIRDSLTAIGLVGWMFYLNAVLASVFLIVGPFVTLIVVLVAKRFRKISTRIQNSMGSVSRVVEESIKANIVVKVYGGKDYEREQFEGMNETNFRQNMRLMFTSALSTSVIQFILASSLAGIIFVATNEHFLRGQITQGDFASFMFAMFMLFAPIRQLTTVNAEFQRGIAAANSVFGFVDQAIEKDHGDYRAEHVKGLIEFNNLSFQYASNGKQALKNINLTIQPGQTVAFVGRSGSGKTSLLNLIPRLYETGSGEIKLDGVCINDYQLDNLRDNIAYVGQDIVLFNDTIEHNIAYGSLKRVDRESIINAARSAHALEFIEKMSDKFESIVGERGVMLSGGQRQRIAIARALLKDAPVLILDEATSALDTESEKYIQSSLEELMLNRTTLVIAHRLSTIENADLIVVLEDGEIVEQGTHHELLQLDGKYASLYAMQFGESDESDI